MPTVADALADTLKLAGIERVFGLPGGENTEITDALRRAALEFVLVANESSAVFMADVTARLTGKPGVCLTTLGPGAANAVAGVAHAYLDRAPVLVITAQTPARLLPYHTHQVINLAALFAPITKQSVQLGPVDAQKTIRAALALTTAGRPGPVHVAISSEDAARPAEVFDPLPDESTPPQPAMPDIGPAQNLLWQARRPAIVAGIGIEWEQPYSALRHLAEAANAPVITTPKAKGILPADHPLAAGTIGLTRTDPAYQLLDEADCIVAVGFDVVELVKPWQQAAPLIWVSPWANENPKIAARFEFVGPVTPVLQQLAETPLAVQSSWGAARVAALRQNLARQPLPHPAAGRLLPQTVLQVVREYLPRESAIATDVGSHKILTGLTWPAYRPGRYFVSNGLSSMGFGLPAAIAAALALPRQPVVCVTGDAGLAMAVGELGLLTRYQLPVVIVVMNDGALDLIRSAQVRAGKQPFGVEFANPDFAQIAAAYRLAGFRATTAEECRQAVKAALAAGKPALIEAMIDPVSYPTTPA